MSEYQSLAEIVDEAIALKAADAIALSDAMAADPEISEQEFRSSEAHVAFLRGCGFEVEYPFFGIPTAYNGTLSSGPGGRVALLAEYDALPGIGHACGHNVHGAMSLLAGAGLAPVMKELGGELRVVGTPAEETNGAKITMAAGGAFDGLDLALMIHSDNDECRVRYRCLAMDGIEFTFKGKTSHAAASPWEGRNALNGAQLFFHAIDMLRQHVRPDVRMHGIYVDGGKACNIVPETAVVRFYFRSPRRAHLNELLQKAYNAARGAAMATETEVEWRQFELPFDELAPNEAAESMMEGVYDELGVPYGPVSGPEGSSDVGNVSMRCPTLQPTLSIVDRPYALHTREFAAATTAPMAHDAIATGAKILARAALRTFLDPGLRASMRSCMEAGRGKA
ncbi:MAG TPA: M20 family metallopeptidase [Spirochaetia bacterium]|nr:M20 family metallopeptidase [Spirochaetales bacterium]HRW24527.1 M20 family metallopeptidase [Spirochaetia bacterium]